jgi:hypothetical protein
LKKRKKEEPQPSPETVQAIESILEMLADCYESKEPQKAELRLGGEDIGDSIIITVKYKGNKNANQSLN